jgi:hypothetical protein
VKQVRNLCFYDKARQAIRHYEIHLAGLTGMEAFMKHGDFTSAESIDRLRDFFATVLENTKPDIPQGAKE